MRLLALGLLCWAAALLNIVFAIFGNPALAPISIGAAVIAIAAGSYTIHTWMGLR